MDELQKIEKGTKFVYNGKPYTSTSKVMIKDGKIGVNVEVEGNTLWNLAREYDLEAKIIEHALQDFAIQGEVIGEGIQGNHYGIKGQDFYVFTVYDVRHGCYVQPKLRKNICELLGLKHVPVIDENCHLNGLTIDQVLKQSDGQSQINPKVLREGIVYKRIDGQEHWKAVSNQYLLSSKI